MTDYLELVLAELGRAGGGPGGDGWTGEDIRPRGAAWGVREAVPHAGEAVKSWAGALGGDGAPLLGAEALPGDGRPDEGLRPYGGAEVMSGPMAWTPGLDGAPDRASRGGARRAREATDEGTGGGLLRRPADWRAIPLRGDETLGQVAALGGDVDVGQDGGIRPHGGEETAAAGLYRALRRGDVGAQWARRGAATAAAAGPTAPPGGGPGDLDLIFQRDARRYGGAFTLY